LDESYSRIRALLDFIHDVTKYQQLPPIHGIKHQIDLIPGPALPNRPPYRSNPEETKEIERHVQELLDKGFFMKV
jgi:hypothetical protein